MSSHKQPFLVFGAPALGKEELEEVVSCMQSGWLGTGPRVARFERAFAEYKGVSPAQVAAVNSCTAALHVSMIAAGIGPGDEVITSPLTFCATVNAIIHSGAQPILADVDRRTMNIDPDAIEAAITGRTKAILPVHFAGRAVDMQRVREIADKHNLIIIEDCAHAVETKSGTMSAGTIGDFGCFSFYVTKNVVTGEGGMVIAKDADAIAKVKRLSLHGLSKDAWHRFGDQGYKHYYVQDCGYKYNMMDLQAAIGIHQLERVETNWEKREIIWQQYSKSFEDLDLTLPAAVSDDSRHAYHLYTILVGESGKTICRDTFLDRMNQLGIGTGVHYLSLAEHPYYQSRYGWKPEDWPMAMKIGRHTVSLPLSAKLEIDEVKRVIDATRKLILH